MKRVTCKDCGRAYDYEKDDFCPKCGSYNPPRSEGATALEAQLLSRFDGGQRNQNRAKGEQAAQGQDKAQYSYSNAALLDRERPTFKKGPLLAVVIVLVAAAMAIAVLLQVGTGFFHTETEQRYYSSDIGEIEVGRFHVEVDGVRAFQAGGSSTLYQEGYGFLAVDVYITGGSGADKKAAVGDVYLELPDGIKVLAVGDALQVRRLKDLSENAVDLNDALWEDPLLGSFLFPVPVGTDRAVLCMEEAKGAGDKAWVAVEHLVEITVPEGYWQ